MSGDEVHSERMIVGLVVLIALAVVTGISYGIYKMWPGSGITIGAVVGVIATIYIVGYVVNDLIPRWEAWYNAMRK